MTTLNVTSISTLRPRPTAPYFAACTGNVSALRLLFDTDAFCKLAVGGVLSDTLSLLGADLTECGRLPALPFMLRRGGLRQIYGPEICDSLIPMVDTMPVAVQPSDAWLDKLTAIPAIDPGEAQIFALAAETGLLVVSGDKRALSALKDVVGYAEALAGRIVVFEAVLLSLCDRLGPDEMRLRIQALSQMDKVVQVCFSATNPVPQAGLLSYYRNSVAELKPLILWNPGWGGVA